MHCTLHIPHLIPPPEVGEALWRTVDAPQLKAALARAVWAMSAAAGATSTDALLCNLFGVTRQHDWPLAPLLARGENLAVDNGYWLCATPVHLETRRNALMLTDPATLAITATESAAFAAMLAEHLRDEQVSLHAPQVGRWFLRCDTPPVMTTTSLDTVLGRDVRTFLPQGADSARWHRILTEIQMLLHAHPLNDAREARGAAAVNSVWLWAGGTLPAAAPTPFDVVWSDDAVVCALARHAGCRVASRPTCITQDTLTEGAHLFSFEWLTPLMQQGGRGDIQAWSNAVTALNRDWFNPLFDALKSRRLSSLTLIRSNDNGTQRFIMRASDSMKFWRKNKYLQ
jgi:hypothetical protein